MSCGVSVVVCVYTGIVQNELKCGYNASVVHASSFHPDICMHTRIHTDGALSKFFKNSLLKTCLPKMAGLSLTGKTKTKSNQNKSLK